MDTASDSSSNTQWIATLSFVIGLVGLMIYYFVDIKITRKADKSKPPKLPPNAQPDKSVIQCDAIGCSKANPSKKCGQCKMVYYCDADCQKKHWKYHKSDCKVAKEQIYAKVALQKEEIQEPPKAPKDAECSICLAEAEEMKHPIVLKKCQHVFCYKCLEQYQAYQQNLPRLEPLKSTPCPYCKAEMEENVRETVLAKALLYAARASRSGLNHQEKLRACQLAIDELKALGKPESDQDVLQANVICGEIAVVKGDYKDALTIFEQNERILTKLVQRKKKVDELLAKGQALGEAEKENEDGDMSEETYQKMQEIQNEIMSIMAEGGLGRESDLIDCRLEAINVRVLMEEWEIAKDAYKAIMTEYPEQSMMSPPQQRKVFMGFARCMYEEGNYDGSISLGEAAVEMNRHFPGVHKYIALSLKEKGLLDEAGKVLQRAALYETPWDEDHREIVRDMWIKVNNEG